MAITLNGLMINEGSAVYYDSGFRQMLEDHLSYLKDHPQTESVEINPSSAHKGHGDLVSVLQDYAIEPRFHWIIMRLNGYTSPMEYQSDRLVLKIPQASLIDGLTRVYRVNRKLANKSRVA
jgi:hypothetical protein